MKKRKLHRTHPAPVAYVFKIPETPAEFDERLAAVHKQIDDQIDELAATFTRRLGAGEPFEQVMLDLANVIIDEPVMWPREAIATLALRSISRIAEAGEPNDQG